MKAKKNDGGRSGCRSTQSTRTAPKLLAFAVGSMIAAQATAQLEEVIVTAQKRSESLQDVPIAVSAFTNEGLQEFGIVDTQSLQMVTPGLVYNNSSSGGSPYLRGVGTRLSTLGLESSVATYIDDRYISRSGAAMFDLADIERIEVLKGPQGTLYGRNATGGAIRVITKDPGEELEGEIGATVGNENRADINGYVGGPVTDSLRAQVSAASNTRDGYADNIFKEGGNSEFDDRDFQAYRGKLIWDINDMASVKFSAAYWERDDTNAIRQQALDTAAENVGLASGGITGTKPDEVASALNGNIKLDETSYDLRFDISFEAFDFASITTYANYNLDGISDSDGTSYQTLDVYTYEDSDTTTQEFQLVSNSDGKFRWIVGGYYFDQDGDAYFKADFSGGALVVSNQMQHVETTAYALFGQLGYDISENWSLTLGGRYSDEEKDVKQTRLPGTTAVGVGPLPFSDDESWDDFTPMATLEYRGDIGMVYLTYSQGFKSGGFNYPAANPAAVPLDPEVLDSYELGYKGDLLDGMLRLNGALFYYDYSDLQVTRAAQDDGSGSIALTTENAADAQVFGLEADVTWLATDALTLTGGFSALDTEYKDYSASAKVPTYEIPGGEGPGYSDVLFDADGESMLRAPDFSGFISARYEFDLGKAAVPVVLTYSYTDDYNFDFIGSPSMGQLESDSYGLLSARISYVPNSGNWSASIWGNNLTDEEYFNEVTANGFALTGSYAPPITYGIDLSYMF